MYFFNYFLCHHISFLIIKVEDEFDCVAGFQRETILLKRYVNSIELVSLAFELLGYIIAQSDIFINFLPYQGQFFLIISVKNFKPPGSLMLPGVFFD